MDAPQAVTIRNKIIGILIRQARAQSGKSQRECAEFLDCSPSTFSQYERGLRGLSLPQLEALAYYFDVPPVHLWDDSATSDQEAQPDETLPIPKLVELRRKMLAVQFRQYRQAAGMTQREMGDLIGCSTSSISQYEQGKRDIPFAELELAAQHMGRPLEDFFDEHTIPLCESETNRRAIAQLEALSPDVRSFVLNPTNGLYLRIAILLSAMKADSLRQIAETILDITY